jgi:endonuclease G
MKKFTLIFGSLLLLSFAVNTINTTKDYKHKAYNFTYSETWKQSTRVQYALTEYMVQHSDLPRIHDFKPDPLVPSSMTTGAYTKTGFDRGHLIPAADMEWDVVAQKESFFTTNISPQYPSFNRGEWKRLEERVRKEAIERDSLIVWVGPIFVNPKELKPGFWIPTHFYKVIFDPIKNEHICFLFPHNAQIQLYETYVVNKAAVEKMVGFSFGNIGKEKTSTTF